MQLRGKRRVTRGDCSDRECRGILGITEEPPCPCDSKKDRAAVGGIDLGVVQLLPIRLARSSHGQRECPRGLR